MGAGQTEGKRTKIVATIGPASGSEERLRQLIRRGMNVARINFSHGTHRELGAWISRIRRIATEEETVVAIMCDLQGPKIRIGEVRDGPLTLATDDIVRLTLDEELAASDDPTTILLPHPEFTRDVHIGMPLLLDDGNLEFTVIDRDEHTLICRVVIDGVLTSRKGVSAPTAHLTLSAITEKDRRDLAFALQKGTDFIAMSFVRSENDLRQLRQLIGETGVAEAPWLIAKIEKHEALENIEAIVAESDGVMVARGDLGVETPAEEVPVQQKRIIRLCNRAGKPVITATQMLNSMVGNPRPTRAEASDVYNAIMDGSDAVMLSNETAVGRYPVASVATMASIAVTAERSLPGDWAPGQAAPGLLQRQPERVSDAVSQATCQIAASLGCAAIITFTKSGYTALQIARERAQTPVLCVTPDEHTYRRMALVWGVVPMMTRQFNTIDEMIGSVVRAANRAGMVRRDESLVITAGVPFGIGGQTNFLKVHVVGESGEL